MKPIYSFILSYAAGIAALMLLVFFLGLLTACGGSDEPDSIPTETIGTPNCSNGACK